MFSAGESLPKLAPSYLKVFFGSAARVLNVTDDVCVKLCAFCKSCTLFRALPDHVVATATTLTRQ